MTAITYVNDETGQVVTEWRTFYFEAYEVHVKHTASPTGFLAFGSGCHCGKPAVFHVARTHMTGGGTSHWYGCPDHLLAEMFR